MAASSSARRALADDFRVIAIDLRGHGESRGAGARPTVEQLAADVAELADALDLEGAIGVGWSLGATVLWHVLAGPGGGALRRRGRRRHDRAGEQRRANGTSASRPRPARRAASRSATISQAFAATAGQAHLRPAGRARRPADGRLGERANSPATIAAAIGSVWASLVRQDVRALLQKIAHPTLIVHGARSRLYGDDTADHLVAALPDARAVRFDRSGHAPHLEEPLCSTRPCAISRTACRAPAPTKPPNDEETRPMSTSTSLKTALKIGAAIDRARRLRQPRLRPGRARPDRRRRRRSRPPPPDAAAAR